MNNKNYIKQISIQGFRGFKEKQVIKFAYPSNECKSGLNILVGQNCSGKSTILECIMMLMKKYSRGYFLSKLMRHNEIELSIEMDNINSITKLNTTSDDKYFASLTTKVDNNSTNTREKNYFFIPAKKNVVNNNLYQNSREIKDFVNMYQNNSSETINRRIDNQNNEFISILTSIYANKDDKKEFNKIFKNFFKDTSWELYMSDEQQNSFIVDIIDKCGEAHFEGVGDGLITIIYICVGIFLLKKDLVDVLLIDEPEVSLHTELIKKMGQVIKEYAKEYQIIISTHSPYLIDWESIQEGGKLIRTLNNGQIEINELDNSLVKDICMEPSNNPHIYGTTAKEVFFLKDNIILVEGQEDVVCYNKIIKKLSLDNEYNFYGWGTGGADNLLRIMKILRSLGYKKVVALFDGDDAGIKAAKKCKEEIGEEYKIINIAADDIREKYRTVYYAQTGEEKIEKFKDGICDEKFKIKSNFDEKFAKPMKEIFDKIDEYFNG